MVALLHLRSYLYRRARVLLLGLVFVLLANGVALLGPLALQRAIDSLAPGQRGLPLWQYALLIVLVALAGGVFSFGARWTINSTARYVEYEMRNALFRHFQRLDLGFFQQNRVGDLVARATNDLSAVRMMLGPGISNLANTGVAFVLTMLAMAVLDWRLTLLAGVFLPAMTLVFVLLGQRIERSFRRVQDQFGDLSAMAQENFSGIRAVKAYTQEEHETAAFSRENLRYLGRSMSYARMNAALWPAMSLVSGLSLAVLLLVGGNDVIAGRLSLGKFVQFNAYLGQLAWPMIALGWSFNLFQQGGASLARIREVMERPPAIADRVDEWRVARRGVSTYAHGERRDADKRRVASDEWRDVGAPLAGGQGAGRQVADGVQRAMVGSIEFRGVEVAYDGRVVLRDINLTIPAGATVAIVGPTGAGKSSLLNLLPRVIDPARGSVLVDGVDTRDWPLADLRRGIGYVSQETFLFSVSLAENVAYGVEEATPAEVEGAATIARLSGDVADFPRGYATTLGERGVTLSGGQKQRASIARAVMKRPRILLLDDALASVDTHTEEEILRGLRGIMAERTALIVSHRVSTVRDAALIVVLDDGRIAEQGTHAELVARRGLYAAMYRRQLLAEELDL